MEFVAEATIRTQSGKGAARQIRRNGQIPAVLYGQGTSRLIQLDPKSIQHILVTQAGSTGLISLTIQGDEQAPQRTAVIQDVQQDPLDGSLLHVDLLEVSMDKPVRVTVPVHMTGGVPIGVKRDKGVMHQSMRELHIECLPNVIPDQIDVDASALEINQGIHVRDLQAAEGIKILDDPEGMVVNVAVPISEEKLSAMLTSEAAPAAEAPEPERAAEAPAAPATPSEPSK